MNSQSTPASRIRVIKRANYTAGGFISSWVIFVDGRGIREVFSESHALNLVKKVIREAKA